MTILFPDVSHYQTGLRLSGAVAVIAKATQGTSYTDPTYGDFKAQAAALGIPFAAYHWLDAADAAAQARHAYSVIGPNTALMIDDEQGVINVAHTLAFVRVYRALGGQVVLEYAPQWVWANSGRPDLRPLAAAGLGLVSSNYPAAGYTEAGPGWTPYGGVTPTIWQYTDKQPFNGQRVDFNGYRGSVDQIRMLLAVKPIQEDVMADFTDKDVNAWTQAVRVDGLANKQLPDALARLERIEEKLATPAPVAVDASAVAAALAGNTAFLSALAKAVNDDAAARLAS